MKTETKIETETETEFDYSVLLEEHKTVSGVIRYLNSIGKNRSEISKITGKRYQHVRNVLVTPLKK
jgi:uncharacterized protein with HEPN domain